MTYRDGVDSHVIPYPPTIMVDDQSLEALANLLNLISENPFDLSLHVQHIRLAQSLPGMDAEVQSAMEMLTSFYAANEDVWTHLIKLKKDSADLNTEEGVNEVLALYEQAENDYLCASLNSLPTSLD